MDERVEEIRERVERWKKAKTPKGTFPSTKEIEAWHDVKDRAPEDIDHLLDRLQVAEERVEELERALDTLLQAAGFVTVFVTSREKIKDPEGVDWWRDANNAAREALREEADR